MMREVQSRRGDGQVLCKVQSARSKGPIARGADQLERPDGRVATGDEAVCGESSIRGELMYFRC